MATLVNLTGKPDVPVLKSTDLRALQGALNAIRERLRVIDASLNNATNVAGQASVTNNQNVAVVNALQLQVSQLSAAVAALSDAVVSEILTLDADTDLGQYAPVWMSSSTGVSRVILDDPQAIYGVIGVTVAAASRGSKVRVQRAGVLRVIGASFTLGAPVFASIDGGLTQFPSYTGIALPIGVAAGSDSVGIAPAWPILLAPGPYSTYEGFLPVAFDLIRQVYEAITYLLAQPNGFVILTNGVLSTSSTPPPPGEAIFQDDFDGSGSITAHTPNLEPAGTPAWSELGTAISLTGTGAVEIPSDGTGVNGISIQPALGTFTPPTGRSYIEFMFTLSDPGDGSTIVEFDFGTGAADTLIVTASRVSAVESVLVELNGSPILNFSGTVVGETIRVEFQNVDQELFVGGVSQDVSTDACSAVVSAVDSPQFFIADGSTTPAVGQTILCSLFGFGGVT